MSKAPIIERITPAAAIPGGEIGIDLASSPVGRTRAVTVGEVGAHIVAASHKRILALVPEAETGEVTVTRENGAGTATLTVGRKIAGEVHPVANPAFDPADGSLYVTRSGSRGEHVPVSLYRVTSDGIFEEFSGDITNPTAIAFSRRGQMFVTSRLDGNVYRVSTSNDSAVFASELGT